MRVAVLGAGGTIAPAIVRDLAASDEVAELRLLDLDLRRAEAVAIEHGGSKAEAYEADARSGLAEKLDGIDVVINSAAYRVNLDVMEACLEAGAHYIDLGGLYHVSGQQLEQSSRFEQAGLLALLGIGSAPGKTNLLGVKAREALGGDPDRMVVAAASRDLDPPDDAVRFPYALQTLLDEITLAPMAFRRRSPRRAGAAGGGPHARLRRPDRPRRDDLHAPHGGPDLRRRASARATSRSPSSLPPRVLDRLKELADAGEDEVAAAAADAAKNPPSPNTASVHQVIAERGEQQGDGPKRHPAARRVGLRGRDPVDRVAGRRCGPPAGARRDHRPRRAAARSLHRPRCDVRGARDAGSPL